MTPDARAERARIAALSRWSAEDPAGNAARGQAGLMARFEREVDPLGELSDAERTRRAHCARRVHMIRLAQLSRRARRSRAAREAGETG